ncbi:MAG: superoxide dismutase [Ni] [Verrucomicrobiota bacterium JB023]|nr:superoxide dismutase [Ni] [Verrucomicrobiota bacterium JB023]
MKNYLLSLIIASGVASAPALQAHCQIPCGIYADNNVIEDLHTDWLTIEKATKQIDELSKDPAANAHQLTRWIMNKESHAQSIQQTVLDYFMAQRLKPATDEAGKKEYMEKLELCHQVIVTAMKCKQSTDSANVDKLHDLLHEFEKAFGNKEQ